MVFFFVSRSGSRCRLMLRLRRGSFGRRRRRFLFRRRRSGLRRGNRLGSSGSRLTVRSDRAYHSIYLDGRAFGYLNILQHTGSRRGNLRIHLIGRNLKQRLVALNFVAGLLQPLGNCAFDDGFAHLRHHNVSRHSSFHSAPRSREANALLYIKRQAEQLRSRGPDMRK